MYAQTKIDRVKQFSHIILIALMIAPNCMFYASANILSSMLYQNFNSTQVAQLSYTVISIPSIFSIVSISLLIDAYGTVFAFPILYLILCLGALLCAVSGYNMIVFLAGRLMFGIAGECTQTSQSKIISKIINPSYHPTAYALSFCGYMLGEALAAFLLPFKYSIPLSMYMCLIAQSASFACSIFYSFVIRRHQRAADKAVLDADSLVVAVSDQSYDVNKYNYYLIENGHPAVVKLSVFKNLKQQLKLLPRSYFMILSARVLYMSAKTTYDSRSVRALATLCDVDYTKARQFVLSYSATSAASFLLFSMLSLAFTRPTIYVVFGDCVAIIVYIIFSFIHFSQMGFVVSIMLGSGFGAFASNASALLVRLAGKDLGASALGIVFSIQYVAISGRIPLGYWISGFGEQINGYIYLVMVGVAVFLLVGVGAKVLRWK